MSGGQATGATAGGPASVEGCDPGMVWCLPAHARWPSTKPVSAGPPALSLSLCHREALRQAEQGAGPLAADLADLQRQLAELVLQPIPLPAGSRASSRRSSRPASGRGVLLAAADAAAELEPQSPLALEGPELRSAGHAQQLGAAGSRHGSPRIRAVHSRAEQQAVGGASALESSSHGSVAPQQPSSLAMVSWTSRAGQVSTSASKHLGWKGGERMGKADASAGLRLHDLLNLSTPAYLLLTLQASKPAAAGPEEARRALQQLLEMEMAREGEREELLQACASDGDRARLELFFAAERKRAMALMQQLQQQLQ